jgi:hypothetical protein
MAAAGEPLQQSSALAHGAALLVRTGPRIVSEAFLVCLVGLPVDETRMMVRDQHLPFGAWQAAQALLAAAGGIEEDLPAGFPVDVGAGINRVGEHVVDGGAARLDPSDLAALMHPQREFEPLRTEPQPDPPGRAGLGEAGKDLADSGADGFVGMKADLAVFLAPDKAHRQAASEFALGRLVADAAIEAGAQYMQLGF